ncbi:MAG: P1 family peptidase [Parasporobacterium sp.]|nr:P1 family peptidase [Parasporobacterium sp.]
MAERIRDWGLVPGLMKPGRNNSITDVPGVKVGHYTLHDSKHHTGVTVIIPRDDIYYHRCTAACEVINGFGKTSGLVQIDELGQLETPIALTNTLNVGLVYDALVEYTSHICKAHDEKLKSVNPVVGECNDGSLNHIRERVIGYDEVMSAIRNAENPEVTEGNAGAGAGMVCHGLKGGIGTASRIVETEEGTYTIGMLALCNHGVLEELNVLGMKKGQQIKEKLDSMVRTDDSGSCVLVLATDMPLCSRQLKRVVKRSAAGLARCGSFWGHGSGDIAIGFTTAHDNIRNDSRTVLLQKVFNEDHLDQAFAAAAECAEECVLNALAAADRVKNCHCLSEFRELFL